MTDENHIGETIERLRDLYKDVALLLRTSEGLVAIEGGGWEPARGNTAVAYSSNSLNSPRKWLTGRAFRFFKNVDFPNILLFVCVILDEQNGKEPKQPVVSAGFCDYGEGQDIEGPPLDWWYAWWHLWMPERKDDGSVNSVRPKEEWPEEHKSDIQSVTTLAVPLMEVKSEGDLKEMVIGPILKEIKNKQGETK